MKESGLEELKIVLFIILSLSTNKNVILSLSQIKLVLEKKIKVIFCRVLFEDLRKVLDVLGKPFRRTKSCKGLQVVSMHEIE
jgi:hypothetical protein